MSIVIDLKIDDGSVSPSFTKVEKILDKLEAVENRLINATKALGQQAVGTARGFGQVANQANRAATAASRAASASAKIKPPPRFGVNNPQATISQYGQAALSGDPVAQRWVLAAQQSMNRQKRVQNILNPPDPVMQAVMRSRFVQQGNRMVGMPLGVDIMKLMASGNGAGLGQILNGGLGGGAMAVSPMILAITGVTAAVTGLALVIKAGHSAIKASSRANLLYGGSIAESTAAMRSSAFSGANPSSVLGNVGGGGISGAIAASMGVSPVRGFFGETNDARDFLKIVRAVGNMSPQEARRYAIGLGSPELAKYALLSGSTRERLAQSKASGMNPADQKMAAEFDAMMTLTGDALARVAKIAAAPIMRIATVELDRFSRVLEATTNIAMIGMKPMADLFDRIMDVYEAVSGGGARKTPIDKNTKAIEDLTQTMKDGISGGGDRTNRARPQGMQGNPGYDEAVRNRQIRTSPI